MVPPPLLHRIRLTLLALAVVLVCLGWLVARPRPASVANGPVHMERSIPLTDVAPYGANFFLEREADPWVMRRTVEMARQAGIRWAKQQFLWAYIEPESGRYEWQAYDAIVDLLLANDIEVIARLDWPPDWVAKQPWVAESFRRRQNAPPADVQDYARFVAATVRHFQGRVRFYQVWNEPNLLSEWGFNPAHPVDPAEYVELLAAAAGAARAVDPNVVILLAPLAINVESVDLAGNMSDLDYLRGLYEAGAGPYFDVLTANAFGMDQPPEAEPSAAVLNFRRVELQRAVMERFGDAAKPVWLNEYGWNAAPDSAREAIWQRVDEERQAEWTVAGVRLADQRWPWSGVFSIWYFRQWGDLDPARAVYYFRMVDVDFTPRRVYAAVQSDAAGRFVAGTGTWAERSAPVALPVDPVARMRWNWVWADGARDRGALESSEPGATLSFPFRGRGVEVRLLTGPQAGSVHVELDGRRVPGADGGPIWPLQAPEPGWRWLTLADGLGAGVHELRLTVGTAGGQVAIDSFRVLAAGANGPERGATVAALALAAALLVVVLAADTLRAVDRLRS